LTAEGSTVSPESQMDVPGYLSGGYLRDNEEEPFHRHAFNAKISNSLSPTRLLPDTRDKRCSDVEYVEDNLPTISVVISFHNEARSSLVRTVLSVLRRTPDALLEDLILVDDASDDPSDGALLASLPRVKLLRNQQRQGLIRSRVLGADASRGDTIFFMDSHCEVNVGWAQPLLETLRLNERNIVCPVIDVIDQDTLQYRSTGTTLKGGFDWGLHFKWVPLTEEEKAQHYDPIANYKSPAIAGGLFLIGREWWETLGKYDPDLEIWGAENLEMSFKGWMCGGSVEVAPCSRVGHIFRKKHPYSFPDGNAHTYLRNSRRIAEVWLDEYSHLFYETRPNALQKATGDLSERKMLRTSLNCEDFGWYINTVYPELQTPSRHELAYGHIRQVDDCLQAPDVNKKKEPQIVTVTTCNSERNTQEWSLTQEGTVQANNGFCLTSDPPDDPKVYIQPCTEPKKQEWVRSGRRLQYGSTDLCLDTSNHDGAQVKPCHETLPAQAWDFSVELQAFTTL
ncbi:unnamed protein product, partial [Meganyctiphanes norvegica]